MKRLIKIAVLVLCLIMPFSVFSAGCNNNDARSIVSIIKTDTQGLTDIYTITYSDGTTSTFEIRNGENGTNGANGQDGEDLDITDLFERYLQDNPTATYEDFLKSVLVYNPEINATKINEALLSSAKIYTEFTETYLINPFQSATDTSIACGSAVVYKINTDYTYFITNYHVVYSATALETDKIAKRINLYLYGSEGAPVATGAVDGNGCRLFDYGDYALSAEFVGGSATYDVAIVKVPTAQVFEINDGVKAVTFADKYFVGQTAIAIGNPEDDGISATQGIVSVDNEYINLNVDGTSRAYRSIRIDTAIYNGSSGGGLFNSNGDLIGITNAGDGTDQNVNYAIPLPIVKGAVENIMNYAGEKSVKKISLGVEVVVNHSKYEYDATYGYGKIVEEIIVSAVQQNSVIERLGVSVNDKIISIIINSVEHKINRTFDIGDLLLTIRAGDVINVKYERNSQVKLGTPYTVLDSDLAVVK